MGVDTDMWLSLKTTRQEQAMEIFAKINSGEDKELNALLDKMSYWTVSAFKKRDYDGNETYGVNISTHTFRGYMPFGETARYLLDTYQGIELKGGVTNDCYPLYEVDQLDLSGQYYSFWLDPGDWEHFFQGDYMHSGSGRQLEHNRKAAENRKARENNPETKSNKNDDLPF